MTTPPKPITPACQCGGQAKEDDELQYRRDRVFWLSMRRAMLNAVKAIENRYDVSSDDRGKRAA